MDEWTAHVRRGNFTAAWEVSDRVMAERLGRSCIGAPRHLQWIWDGTPLVGRRVLVRCYHGLGDTIQFARYAPLLSHIAAETTWWAQPELLPLLRSIRGMGYLLPLHDGEPEVEYDVDIESMELSHAFRSTLESIPRTVPYLHAQPLRLRRTTRLAVGLVIRAGAWDPRRSIPQPALAPLATIPDVRFYAVHEPTILGTARLMLALDLLITVDSMPAHLAGALGVPVWTLLHHDADWRWMVGRDTSPWYPTMRLFRQPSAGDWNSVVHDVREALLSWRYDAKAL